MGVCSKTRRILWPADTLRVSDEALEAALEHAAACPDCRSFLEEDRRVAELIRQTVPRARAPRELRERLYTVLARERAGVLPEPSNHNRRSRGVAVALLVIAALAVGGVGHWLGRHGESAAAATAFAEDYLRRAMEQDELRTADPEAIASFFTRELGVSMPPPRVPQFEVQRAVICLMNGKRGGVVEYRAGGRHLAYYLIPHPSSGSDAATEATASSATRFDPALAEERGLGVATWWDGEHQHALVGNLPPEELKRLAPLFLCPTSRL